MISKDTPLRLGKTCQISAPSHPQIVELFNEITHRISLRRRFNGGTITKQTVINCIIVAMAELGPETWDYLFDHGASILGPALMAGEPGIPLQAGRPLKKRFRWFNECKATSEAEAAVKPPPPIKLRKDAEGRRRLSISRCPSIN